MLPEPPMQTTLTLQVTKVQFDFDEEDFTPELQQEVVDYALGNTFEVEVDDVGDERQIADALVECVTDLTGWCVVSLNYREVTN
jgi:exoribonuclease R